VGVTPVILAVVFTESAPTALRLPVLVVGAAGYGLALAWGGVRSAAMAAEPKLPELAQVAIQSSL
jgi:ABC-2 type transport system permease protein